MSRAKIVGGAVAIWLVLIFIAVVKRAYEDRVDPVVVTSAATTSSDAAAHRGLLYGRVTTDDGEIYEGRLRWGRDEEALWSNYFNGFKDKNPWVAQAPAELLPTERPSIEILGIEIGGWERQVDLGRPFMARFGDIVRIEPLGRDIQVTLKSGTVVTLDRYSADDLADGVRVWDSRRGVVHLGERRIRSIEFLPTARLDTAPDPLHGTVHTQRGEFTGLIQWDREACLSTDVLNGHSTDGERSLPFHTIQSIERRPAESSLVTLFDGRKIVLSGTREVGPGNRGVYVDDPRYGRVLVSWDAFERVDFSEGGTSPGYDDYRAARALTGSVITRSGRRISGRLVYDLDESETVETLDAPSEGVDYTIPFGRIATIVPGLEEGAAPFAKVTLQSGEDLELDHAGDLGDQNAGILIFVDDRQLPEYVAWADVRQIDLDRPQE